VRRAARVLSIALITAGLVVLADVGLTLVYREPLSYLYASIRQSAAAADLEELEDSYSRGVDLERLGDVPLLARRFARRVEPGDAIGRIEAPGLGGLDAVVVEGTDSGSLQKGPGHYPQTPMPGAGGTTAIAGHRTTYLAPFREIDSAERGEAIRLEMPYATFTYRVQKTAIVEPDDVGVARPVGYDRLVLSACHPLYSAAERFIVFARLRRIEPAAAAVGD
jgi:sortase A